MLCELANRDGVEALACAPGLARVKVGVEGVGAVVGEDFDGYFRMRRGVMREWRPGGESELALVDRLVGARWRMKRIEEAERAHFVTMRGGVEAMALKRGVERLSAGGVDPAGADAWAGEVVRAWAEASAARLGEVMRAEAGKGVLHVLGLQRQREGSELNRCVRELRAMEMHRLRRGVMLQKLEETERKAEARARKQADVDGGLPGGNGSGGRLGAGSGGSEVSGCCAGMGRADSGDDAQGGRRKAGWTFSRQEAERQRFYRRAMLEQLREWRLVRVREAAARAEAERTCLEQLETMRAEQAREAERRATEQRDREREAAQQREEAAQRHREQAERAAALRRGSVGATADESPRGMRLATPGLTRGMIQQLAVTRGLRLEEIEAKLVEVSERDPERTWHTWLSKAIDEVMREKGCAVEHAND